MGFKRTGTLRKTLNIIRLSFLVLIVLSLSGCGKEQPAAQQEVVVYTSLDKVFSQPGRRDFPIIVGKERVIEALVRLAQSEEIFLWGIGGDLL